jgi:hypothetical protein
MSEKLNQVAARLLQKHIPKGLVIDVKENWLWLDNLDEEDTELLLSVKTEIKRKMESISIRYDEGWFSVLCRRLYQHEKLKAIVFGE